MLLIGDLVVKIWGIWSLRDGLPDIVNFRSAWLTPVHPNKLKLLKWKKYVYLFVSSSNINWCIPFALQPSSFVLVAERFCPSHSKGKGVLYLPIGKFQNVSHFRILSLKMETLNRPNFNEIDEMTCITHTWWSPGETFKWKNSWFNKVVF